MSNLKNRGGMATLLVVFASSIVSIMIISAWQIQYLYSLHRGKAMSDALTLGYHAESRIYDILARFTGGYANAFTFPMSTTETLPDGTILSTQGTEVDDTQTLTVTSKRQFATTKVQLTRVVTENPTEIGKDTEIVLSLDCTGSMSQPACSSGCPTTRMQEQKKAVLSFLDSVKANPGADKVKIGISVFQMSAQWMSTAYAGDGTPIGTTIRPDSSLTIDQIKQAVTTGFGNGGDTLSPACRKVQTATSIGSGLMFMHNYFSGVSPTKNRIEVLISDGEPNQRIPDPACPVSIFCPLTSAFCCPAGTRCNETKTLAGNTTGWNCPAGSGESACSPYARDFVRCALATTDRAWVPEKGGAAFYSGARDPNVSAYVVTVIENPPASVVSIFSSFADKYYNSANATQLTEILQDIFQEIITSITNYSINKVVPEP